MLPLWGSERRSRASVGVHPLPDTDVNAVHSMGVGAAVDLLVRDGRAALQVGEPVEQALAHFRFAAVMARHITKVTQLKGIRCEIEELRAHPEPMHVFPTLGPDHPRTTFANAASQHVARAAKTIVELAKRCLACID